MQPQALSCAAAPLVVGVSRLAHTLSSLSSSRPSPPHTLSPCPLKTRQSRVVSFFVTEPTTTMLYTVAALGACTYLYMTDSPVAKVVVSTVKAAVWPKKVDDKQAPNIEEKKTDSEDKDWVLY